MKRIGRIWLLLALLAPAVAGAATPARALVYLSPQLYAHEVKLWHFYYSYWFSQGEAIEPVALEEFGQAYGAAGLCTGNEAGDLVVWLKPSMFYNPHFTTYYGGVEANVYDGTGAFLGAFEGKAKRLAYLDVKTEVQVRETYRAALQDMISKMRQNVAVNTAAQGLPAERTAAPCSVVTVLPTAAAH